MSREDLPLREPVPEAAEATVSALEALEGLPIAGQRLAEVRLMPVVAATLRAALDLMLADGLPRQPLSVVGDDGALEVTTPTAHSAGLSSAGALLETVDGSLSWSGGAPPFRLRVPAASPRPLFLMLQQGTLGLAVPWHAVLRIRLVRFDAAEAMARREGCTMVAPWVTVPWTESERTAVLIGLGPRRALLVADRLVWRMPADPVDADAIAPGPELGREVRTADGDKFWVADPARLLRGVEPPPWPELAVRPAPPRRSAPAPAPAPVAAPRSPAARSGPEPRLTVLRREDVEALPGEAVESAVAPETPSPPRDRAERVNEAPTTPRPARPRALVAEDSIVGRMFLQRLLAPRGFSVETVASARDLERALKRGAWDLLLVDVSLPDSQRGLHLGALDPAALVALVRDREDERVAAEAGVRHTLRKPFDRSDLMRVVRALGFPEERS